jgi:hypothetical protein
MRGRRERRGRRKLRRKKKGEEGLKRQGVGAVS